MSFLAMTSYKPDFDTISSEEMRWELRILEDSRATKPREDYLNPFGPFPLAGRDQTSKETI